MCTSCHTVTRPATKNQETFLIIVRLEEIPFQPEPEPEERTITHQTLNMNLSKISQVFISSNLKKPAPTGEIIHTIYIFLFKTFISCNKLCGIQNYPCESPYMRAQEEAGNPRKY